MEKVRHVISLSAVLLSVVVMSQPQIEWQQSYGGSENDYALGMINGPDNGVLIIGHTTSPDGDIDNYQGGNDLWLIKLDENGNLDWRSTLGTIYYERGASLRSLDDGGYIICGITNTNTLENNGGYDVWIIKTDATGTMEWQELYGGSETDSASDIILTDDQGYLVLGYTASNDGDVTENNGEADVWLLKISNTGALEWQRTYGGTEDDSGTEVHQLPDGFILGGNTQSTDGDVMEYHGGRDLWVIRTGLTGEIQWEKALGGSADDILTSILPMDDGGFIVSGYSASLDGDLTVNYGFDDVWLVKLSANGDIEWQKSYGGSHVDHSHDIQKTAEGGFILAGLSNSYDGDVTGLNGLSDWWVLKLDQNGAIEWEDCIGGSGPEVARAIVQTSDGGFAVSGYTQSNDGDATENNGLSDYWIVKLAPYIIGIQEQDLFEDLSIYPNPTMDELFISFHLDKSTELEFELRNGVGQLIRSQARHTYSQGDHKIEFRDHDIPPGLYQLRFTLNGESVVRPIVKL